MKRVRKRKKRKIRIFRVILLLMLLMSIIVTIVNLTQSAIVYVKEKVFEKPQGRITILHIDAITEQPIKNSKYSITNLESGKLVEIISTDVEGRAVTGMLDYNNEYEIKPVESNPYYKAEDDNITLEVNKESQELIIKSEMHEHIKKAQWTEDENIVIREVYIDVPTVMQKPELPNGCEITSLTSVLNSIGYNVKKTEMADIYLPKEEFYYKEDKLFGANPYIAYAGNPRSEKGWFTFAPPIVEAANNFFKTVETSSTPIDVSGSTREEIIEYLDEGIPVVIWMTLDLSEPQRTFYWYLSDTGEKLEVPINLHAVVINGYTENKVHVMDPLKGQVIYNADAFFNSYAALGSHAMIVN